MTGSKAQLCLPQGQHASRECPSVRPGKQVRGPWAAPPGHRHEQHRGCSPASLSTGDISPQDHSRDVVPVRGGWVAARVASGAVLSCSGCRPGWVLLADAVLTGARSARPGRSGPDTAL